MTSTSATSLANLRQESASQSNDACIDELMTGLTAGQKFVSPKYFYDETGSELFEQITELPEYYPTRTENRILRERAEEIAAILGQHCYLIEPGAGNCQKVRLLLEALRPECYAPVDISRDFLLRAAEQLRLEYPWLTVKPVAADFTGDMDLPKAKVAGNTVIFYPGSTIGNFEPGNARDFLSSTRPLLGEQGGILLGVDLRKDPDRLHAAYNDSRGVTEAFNLNLLDHLNRLLDSNFSRDNFSHRAFYNRDESRVEMHLMCDRRHTVTCCDTPIQFEAGETIHTESSYKYTLEGIAQLAQSAGFSLEQSWVDSDNLFSVNYLATVND